jgi:hypothetical protein
MLSDRLSELEGELYECPLVRFCSTLEPEDSKALMKALDGHVPVRAIHRVLRSEGYRISRETLSTHRRGMCGCRA